MTQQQDSFIKRLSTVYLGAMQAINVCVARVFLLSDALHLPANGEERRGVAQHFGCGTQ